MHTNQTDNVSNEEQTLASAQCLLEYLRVHGKSSQAHQVLRFLAEQTIVKLNVLIAERWLILLREQLSRAKKQELSELVDRLVLAVGASKEYAVGE